MSSVVLVRGQRLALAPDARTVSAGLRVQGVALDVVCFAVDAAGKLVGEPWMVFFNQPASPGGAIRLSAAPGDQHGFVFDLAQLAQLAQLAPQNQGRVERVVITASIDGGGTMAQLGESCLRLFDASGELARFPFSGRDFSIEKSLLLAELYRRDGHWRFLANGQGFGGGLDALVRHFGADVASPAPVAAPVAAAKIDLEKRIAREAPQLVSLVKSAGVSLAKAGLATHRAQVCLVLDISASMHKLYRSGQVQAFAERILALGCQFDDDGQIDVFLFGRDVHHVAPMGLANLAGYVDGLIARHPLEGDTRYGAAIEAVRRHYFPDGGTAPASAVPTLPVYVMFVTDGGTSDKAFTERQLRAASHQPIFWQFMGIGKGRKSKAKALARFADSDFPFLEKLDELDGRLVDNANYFSVASPDEHADHVLYDLLMAEYPGWVKLVRQRGMLAGA